MQNDVGKRCQTPKNAAGLEKDVGTPCQLRCVPNIVRGSTHTHRHTRAPTHARTHARTHTHIYIYRYIYIYIFIYTGTLISNHNAHP